MIRGRMIIIGTLAMLVSAGSALATKGGMVRAGAQKRALRGMFKEFKMPEDGTTRWGCGSLETRVEFNPEAGKDAAGTLAKLWSSVREINGTDGIFFCSGESQESYYYMKMWGGVATTSLFGVPLWYRGVYRIRSVQAEQNAVQNNGLHRNNLQFSNCQDSDGAQLILLSRQSTVAALTVLAGYCWWL